jgi:probable HAF family extracellular repeat protein
MGEMRRLALAAALVSGLGLLAGYGSASSGGKWAMTDVAAQAAHQFPHYTGTELLGITAGGRVIWTAYRRSDSPWQREVFQWRNGRITDLGPLPKHTFPASLNAGGAIVGSSEDPPYCGYGPCQSGPDHAYLWQPGKTTMLGTLGGSSSWALSVNGRGQIVGGGETASGKRRAFLWENGTLSDLATPVGAESSAWAINDRGQILGHVVQGHTDETVLWDHGTTTPVVSSRYCEALTLNNRAQVIGWCEKRGQISSRAFLWQNGKTIDLGAIFQDYAMAINDRGDVIEPEQITPRSGRGILWRDGTKIDLGSLGGPVTFPIALNDRGQVVGVSTVRGSTFEKPDTRAFIWQNGKLEALPSDGSILEYAAAMNINAAGTLVAGGTTTCTPGECAGRLFVWQYRRY